MEFYLVSFALLSSLAILFAYHLRRQRASRPLHTASPKDERSKEDNVDIRYVEPEPTVNQLQAAATFRNNYFAVYALVLAADWLQGPYIYSIYHEDHQLPEKIIAALFGAGFVSAGISSAFLGMLADRYGRRNACFGFCVVTTLSCLSVLAPSRNLILLFMGRALGGLSSTLLYSVFEAWMVTEHNARHVAAALPLSDMFSWSSTLSGIVAITTGIIGECLVSYTGSRAAPFLLAICLLALAVVAIARYWNENYGGVSSVSNARDEEEKPEMPLSTEPYRLLTMERLRLMVLGLTTTVFEGSMYLFVFFWTPTLVSSRELSGRGGSLPLGLIFSSFMCAMMIGSMSFSALSSRQTHPALMLGDVLAVAACALLVPVLWHEEIITFWSFALFELAVGVYFPVMGKLKSDLVHDSVRAQVYTWMRLPLNVFVFIALGVTKEGMYRLLLPSVSWC